MDEDIDDIDLIIQFWSQIMNAITFLSQLLFLKAVLQLERRLISFSGMLVDINALKNAIELAENSLKPASKLNLLTHQFLRNH